MFSYFFIGKLGVGRGGGTDGYELALSLLFNQDDTHYWLYLSDAEMNNLLQRTAASTCLV